MCHRWLQSRPRARGQQRQWWRLRLGRRGASSQSSGVGGLRRQPQALVEPVEDPHFHGGSRGGGLPMSPSAPCRPPPWGARQGCRGWRRRRQASPLCPTPQVQAQPPPQRRGNQLGWELPLLRPVAPGVRQHVGACQGEEEVPRLHGGRGRALPRLCGGVRPSPPKDDNNNNEGYNEGAKGDKAPVGGGQAMVGR